ncbi:hypothetical protein [Dongia rigui]|uniref:Uncharacterized protein n=1 Tax=Dongia rigui TaxID=940149 RepID=A0ABU5DYC6_9PROT|nr:hypothetical protein [Dongia rigui]MDY0872324.1 hypothetical protein [Dongia rigui]
MDNSSRRAAPLRNPLCLAVLGASLVLGGSTLPAQLALADNAVPTYQPWTGTTQGKATQKLLADLKAKIAQAEKDQAGSPDFLDDLKKSIAEFEAATMVSQAQPFLDNFSDGEFATNPVWKVTAGQWQVDKSGSNRGLVSKIRQGANLNALLGNLLNQQGQQQNANAQYAAIYTKAKLPGSFTASTKFTSKDRYGGLQLALYQGASAQNQYRVAYQPGNNQAFLLQKVTASGATTLGAYNGAVNLEDGQPHELTMTRNSAGKMTVLVDGQTAISATDTSLTGDLDGILVTNVGGSYWLREVSVKPLQ